jgi:hypothetical protein
MAHDFGKDNLNERGSGARWETWFPQKFAKTSEILHGFVTMRKVRLAASAVASAAESS